MKGQGGYVPPVYIPLNQSDTEAYGSTAADGGSLKDEKPSLRSFGHDPTQWSSGICACCDDMQSCLNGEDLIFTRESDDLWIHQLRKVAGALTLRNCNFLFNAVPPKQKQRGHFFRGCIGALCPCFLFGKNAEFLGSGTLSGSCMTHFLLWGLVNSLCCLCSGGILLAFPGMTVACYACGYRRALRVKYKLQEEPCGDLTTHLFCHWCAICQEYREIRERSDGSVPAVTFPTVTAPPVQKIDMASQK